MRLISAPSKLSNFEVVIMMSSSLMRRAEYTTLHHCITCRYPAKYRVCNAVNAAPALET